MPADVFERTAYFKPEAEKGGEGAAEGLALLTVFDGAAEPREIDLLSYRKEIITFGRESGNDIVLNSGYVSRRHGQLRLLNGGWLIENNPASTNGLIYDNAAIQSRVLEDEDAVRIDDGVETTVGGVLLIFSTGGDKVWKSFAPLGDGDIRIGRGGECEICLDHISVSRLHAKIVKKDGVFRLVDNNSTNGVMVNGKKVEGSRRLYEKDFILITNSKLIFSSVQISYCCSKSGISVDALNVVKKVKDPKNPKEAKIICNDVDLSIRPCEMVALVGGSGAGKSTVMNCLSGYSKPTGGSVAVNGLDLYENFDAIKNIIGYVPQSDIVYDNLTVADMLKYAAKLRLPNDISESEAQNRIDEVMEIVKLSDRRDTLIKSLSGGQKKRASIAVELLSDPNLFFLDEPASGLDPGTERSLMNTLKEMSKGGKTVIFVTHSTLNLHLCDKVAFMGKGGNLCFYGSYEDALTFFNVDDIVDVYELITEEPEKWRGLYLDTRIKKEQAASPAPGHGKSSGREGFKQALILSRRYLHIMSNDRVRTLMLLLQAPLIALLIALVADGKQYEEYPMTESLLFALSCSAFWLGILNSIQEVCKERNILKREYMTGLRLDAYICSKVSVMALVCLVQAFMLTAVFSVTVGLPDKGVVFAPFFDLFIAVFLTTLSASATGIFVSSLFKNADRAMTVAPLLIIPQLLFSGVIFELSGAKEVMSYAVVCRWSMESLGTTARLNELPTVINEMVIPPEASDFYEITAAHLLTTWAVLCGFVVLFSLAAGLVLMNLNKERG